MKAAIIHARLLLGTYRSDKYVSKYSGGSEACSLPGCSAAVGDIVHLLSGACPALRPKLQETTTRSLNLLRPHTFLYQQVLKALTQPPDVCVKFLLDPSTVPEIIAYKQSYGLKSIYPPFKVSRSIIRCMHREHYRLKGLSRYLSI